MASSAGGNADALDCGVETSRLPFTWETKNAIGKTWGIKQFGEYKKTNKLTLKRKFTRSLVMKARRNMSIAKHYNWILGSQEMTSKAFDCYWEQVLESEENDGLDCLNVFEHYVYRIAVCMYDDFQQTVSLTS